MRYTFSFKGADTHVTVLPEFVAPEGRLDEIYFFF
jgi:hypothetical protein